MERGVGGLTKIVAFGSALHKNNSPAVAGHTGAKFTGREGVCAVLEKVTEEGEREGQAVSSVGEC